MCGNLHIRGVNISRNIAQVFMQKLLLFRAVFTTIEKFDRSFALVMLVTYKNLALMPACIVCAQGFCFILFIGLHRDLKLQTLDQLGKKTKYEGMYRLTSDCHFDCHSNYFSILYSHHDALSTYTNRTL